MVLAVSVYLGARAPSARAVDRPASPRKSIGWVLSSMYIDMQVFNILKVFLDFTYFERIGGNLKEHSLLKILLFHRVIE